MKKIKQCSFWGLLIWCSLVVVSCKKGPESVLLEEQAFFSFTDTNVVVARKDIVFHQHKFVEIDFNADGLKDLAVLVQEGEEDGTLSSASLAELDALSADKAPSQNKTFVISNADLKPKPKKESETLTKKGMNLINQFKGNKNKDEPEQKKVKMVVYIKRDQGDYYMGGKFNDTVPGAVIGMLYRRNQTNKYNDIHMVVHDKVFDINKHVSYMNNGSGFVRVQDKGEYFRKE